MSEKFETAYDAIAGHFDAEFTNSISGKLQRKKVWNHLEHHIGHLRPLDILEINCGTGEDAIWWSGHGHHVTATDASEKMIRIAREKSEGFKALAGSFPEFIPCSFGRIKSTFPDRRFDLIFSNFGGLNCINEVEMKELNADLACLLKPTGKMVIVLNAKHCIWEKWYFFWKGDQQRSRRRRMPIISSELSHGVFQTTWYYHVKELRRNFSSFLLRSQMPVGLFIPPAYMESWSNRYPIVHRILEFADRFLGSIPVFADYGDHVYLLFEKKSA